MKTKALTILIILFGILSCTDNGYNPRTCNLTLVNSELYTSAPNDLLTINSLEIRDDCLKINFSASGCSGDLWELRLIDSDDILQSTPPQRNLRLSLKNVELCNAYITKELLFGISNLKVDGNQVQLNITNSGGSILYEY